MTSTSPHELAAHLAQVGSAVEHISDPVERFAVANELVRVIWDSVGELGKVRLSAVAETREAGYGPRELSKETGISHARICQLRRKLPGTAEA